MADLRDEIQKLQQQLYETKQQQLQLFKRLQEMERELERLHSNAATPTTEVPVSPVAAPITPSVFTEPAISKEPVYIQQVQQKVREQAKAKPAREGKGWEDFIGTNLISKLGIVITIIGIFIGAKYAIDNEWISPLMRIMFGYLAGAGLVVTALSLKKQYSYFSSILAGGGLAVIYFITYIAYGFYQLIPQTVAFILMLLTTMGTVGISLWYNQKIIAIIGQVGAYAIPFLLSDGSGRVAILFSYITIINIGLLILSFKKDWRIVYRIGFYMSWFIYITWFVGGDHNDLSNAAALGFLVANFLTFYATFLAYKMYKKTLYNLHEVILLLLNALLFFFLGAYFISENTTNEHALTWFTLSNALLHGLAGILIYRLNLFDKSVVQFVVALALLFITITIPIELDGNWVTLLWTVEGLLLFTIATRNQRPLYLQLAVPVLIVAVISLVQDWWVEYPHMNEYTGDYLVVAFANLNFWLSVVVAVLFGLLVWQQPKAAGLLTEGNTASFFKHAIPVLFVVMLYLCFFHEIHYAWDKSIHTAKGSVGAQLDAGRGVALIIYTCLYVAILLQVNARLVHKQMLHSLFLVAAIITSIVMLTHGLFLLGEIRENHLHRNPALLNMYLYRYVAIAALALLWLSAVHATRKYPVSEAGNIIFSMAFNATLLTILCNEFISWMDIAGYSNQYKLGITIICGLYALGMLVAGIAKKRKHLRIGAIVLFGATILKLFLYDLASLSTISKTIVLVILGVLLLIASFLYNKYKVFLFTSPGEEERGVGE